MLPHKKSTNNNFEDTRKRFKSFGLRQLPCPINPNSFYLVNFRVYRTHICVELKNKHFAEETLPFLIDQNIIDDRAPPETDFDIYMENIKGIISDYDGFYIILRESNKSFYFSCPVLSNKQTIISKIESNAFKFLGQSLIIEGLTKDYKLNSKMIEGEFKGYCKFYQVLRATEFNDFIRLKMAVNDNYIYEIINDIIVNQISTERILRIGLHRSRLRMVELYYATGEMIKLAINSDFENSFISQIHGIIQQQNYDFKTRFFQNSLIFLGHLNLKSNIVWGIEQVPSFRQAYERENFETFMKEQREENFLNYHFVSGFSGFTLRTFFARFESILNKSLKLIPAFKIRIEFEDAMINFISRPDANLISMKSLIPSNFYAEEDWFSKLPSEERLKSENMRRLIYQTKKIFRDQLKEVLNEECFGEKIENELLIDRMWSFLANMMQSGSIMQEVSFSLNSSNKADSECYVKLFSLAIKILLQGRFINQFIDYSGQSTKSKFEVLNKNFLINKNSTFDFYESISYFLAKILELPMPESRFFISKHILQIESILNIFENLIFRKKESTIEKDLQRTIDLLKSPLYFEVLSQLTLNSEPELIYKASVIMNVIIVCLPDKAKVLEFQSQILDYSTLLLRHIEFCMGSCSVRQKHYSIIFICNCLIDNISACNLMMRLIPKPLFYLVENTLGDISKWSISQWETLFTNMNQDYNSATQQWNADSRSELLIVLKNETENFYKNYKPISQTQTKAFIFEMFKSPNFQISREQEEKIIQLKWNYEEYEVAHKSLKKKFPVYKFYIEEMIVDRPNPELTVKYFKHPKKFWDELTTTLIASTDIAEKAKLIKCMILFYKHQFKAIKYTNIVPFLIKQINQYAEAGFNYLILQLLYTLIENDPLKHNIRRFLDSEGLTHIRRFIQSNLFEDNINEINYKDLENEHVYENPNFSERGMTTILYNAKLELSQAPKPSLLEKVVFLFNNPGVDREAFTPELLRSNEIIFCIKIFQQCILSTKSQTEESLLLIPKPLAKEVAFEIETIELFHRVLLLKDDRLMIAALDFVMISYIDKFNFFAFIKNKWVFPMLLSRINKQNALKISSFFERVITNFYKIAMDEKKLLFEHLKTFDVNSPINDLALYGKNGNRLLAENRNLFEIFDQFPGLCLLPSYFFHVLLTKGSAKFADILFSEQYESPYLLWNRQALHSVQSLLESMLSNSNKRASVEWQTKTIHYTFADELTVGPILLKNWVFCPQYQSILPASNIPNFLKTLTRQLTFIFNSIPQGNKGLLPKLKKFYMITLAISYIYKNHSVYPFEEFEAIDSYLRYYLFHERNEFKIFTALERNYLDCCVINCLKIVSNSIKIENSFEQIDFLKHPNLKLRILRLFQRCVKATINRDLSVSFHQFKMNYILLQMLKKIFLINGSFMVSFKDPMSGSRVHSHDHSESDSDDYLYDINIILANLDVMLVENYINMIANRNAKEAEVGERLRRPGSFESNKELTEKITTTNKSAFKRKGVSDKDRVFEEHGTKTNLRNSSSFQNSLKIEGTTDKARSLYRFQEGGTSTESIAEENKDNKFDPGRESEERIVKFKVNVQETTHKIFKVIHKRLDYDLILKMTSNMNLSTNSVAEILSEIKREVNEKVLQSTSRGTTFYHAVKKLLQSFFLLWVSLVNNLSQNRKNIITLIEASIPFVAFRISIVNVNLNLILNTPVGNEINKFCASSMQIFRNILIPIVELIYQLDKDSENKRRLKEDIKPEILQILMETSNIAWAGVPDNIINYFNSCTNFFTVSFICYVVNNQNNEELLYLLRRGIYELRCYLDKDILIEMSALLKGYISESLESGNLTNFKRLKALEVKKRTEHVCIAGYYIENYIRNPQKLGNPEETYEKVFEVLDSYKKTEANPKMLIEFMIKLIQVNEISTPISSNEFDIILRTVYATTDIETKTLVLIFLKKRLKSRPQELEEALASVNFNITIFEIFFWIEILNQRPLMINDSQENDPEVSNFTPQKLNFFIKKYANLICFLTKQTKISTFQEIMIYLGVTILDEKTQAKLLGTVLNMKDLRVQLQELFATLIETRAETPDPSKALIECFHDKTIIHPLIYFNPKKFQLLTLQLYLYLKTIRDKLATTKQLIGIREDIPFDIAEIYENDFESVIVFDRLNLSLFLISKNNSFMIKEAYVKIIPKLEMGLSQFTLTVESFRVSISVLLMLRSHEFFSQNTQYSGEIVNAYFSKRLSSDPFCEMLMLQYLGRIDSDVVLMDDKIISYYRKFYEKYQRLTSSVVTLVDYVYWESFLLIILKKPNFSPLLAPEDDFIQTAVNLKKQIPELTKLINTILAYLTRNELFSDHGIQDLTSIDGVAFLELGKVNLSNLENRLYRKNFIDNLGERQNLCLENEKLNTDNGFVILPLCYRPDLYNL